MKSDLPIIIVTAPADKSACIQAINLGVNGFFEKPVQVETIKDYISKYRPTIFELKMCSDRKAVFSQNHWVDLTSTEYKILETLKKSPKRLTRGELQSAVWPNSSI